MEPLGRAEEVTKDLLRQCKWRSSILRHSGFSAILSPSIQVLVLT